MAMRSSAIPSVRLASGSPRSAAAFADSDLIVLGVSGTRSARESTSVRGIPADSGINLAGSFRYDDAARETTVRIEMFEDVKFEDGVVLGTIHTGAPISMEGKMLLRPMVQVQLTHKDTVHDVVALLPQLRAEIRRYIDILMHGLADPADDAEWTDAEVVHN